MDPKIKGNKKDSSQQQQQRKQNRQAKKKGKGGGGGGAGKKPVKEVKEAKEVKKEEVPEQQKNIEIDNEKMKVNGTMSAAQEDDLSATDLVDLGKSILEIKKQKDEYNHSHKREKQKKAEERKKMINEEIHKKQELQKQLKIKEEEKKKMLEKQRIETQKELSKIKSQQAQANSGTWKKVTDEKLLDVLKRKASSPHGLVHSSSSNTLRKYSSHSSIGIKSSGALFKTISIPRLSKEQISLLDIFRGPSNDSQLSSPSLGSDNSSQSGGLMSSSSFRSPRDLLDQFKKSSTLTGSGSGLRLSLLKDQDYYSKSNTHKRWEEYAKTLLPTEKEQIKAKKEHDRLKQLDEMSMKSAEDQVQQQSVIANNSPMSPKRLSTHQTNQRLSVNHGSSLPTSTSNNNFNSSSTVTSTSSNQSKELSPEEKAIGDGNKIINALLNKTHSTPRSFACFDNDFSTLSQKPAQIVNIFKYGSVNINFSEIFGDAEDIKGFIMWSVHSFGVEEREYSDFPKLYSKDCYIVLNINNDPQQSKNNLYNLHIWIGKESPIDRIGTLIMMSIQLATHLGGKVNHFREEQGQESKLFINYFFNKDMNGLQYYSGGADSDFNSITATPYQSKVHLYKIDIPPIPIEKSGLLSVRRMGLSKKLVSTASSEISWILESHQKILYFVGAKASVANRNLTRQTAMDLQNFYGKATPIVDSSSDQKEFLKYLKQHKTKSDQDKSYSDDDESIVNLYRTCYKANGKLSLEPISEDYPMSYHLLQQQPLPAEEQVFILDCTTDIFIYSSNQISKKKITAAKECAKIFFNEYDRPKWAEITQIYKGHEPPLFKAQFKGWPKKSRSLQTNPKQLDLIDSYYHFDQIIAGRNQSLTSTPPMPFENDDADQVDVYVVTIPDLEFHRLADTEKTQFYENDCFMTIITSRKERNFDEIDLETYLNEPRTIIYWWEGVTADPKGYSSFIYGLYPIIAGKFQDKGQPKPLVQLIKEKREPLHFIKAFSNPIIIHKGSKFDDPALSSRVYQLIIDPNSSIYIQELNLDNLIFNSHSIYFVVSAVTEQIIIWKGEDNTYTLEDEDLLSYSQLLDEDHEVELVLQGEETEEFWGLLPNVDTELVMDINYAQEKLFRFHLDQKTSKLCVSRIPSAHASDLDPKELCLLETVDHGLFIWIGSNCSDSLIGLASQYLSDVYFNEQNKNPKTNQFKHLKFEYQYRESLDFKFHFASWERNDEFIDPLESRNNNLRVQNTLDYRKECQEVQELFKEYLEYVNSFDNEEHEDFETWTLIKKGYIDPLDFVEVNVNNNHEKLKAKKKKIFKIFSKK